MKELLAAFTAGDTTPSAVFARYEERWRTSDVAERAILVRVPGADEALAESDQRWASGRPRPLEGIPFAVKDIIDVAGTPVTCGSLQTGNRTAPADAEVVLRLRRAGAIPVAMVATTEFAMGAAHNVRHGPVHNPWDPTRWTGGSSTGSGAGLAAGLFPLALGTDTGGSIRIPSAFCGTTGLKPTYERLSRTGVATLSWSMDHVGPMGLSAADLELAFAAMEGRGFVASQCCGSSPLAGLTLGILGGWHLEHIDDEVLAAFVAAQDLLCRLGARVIEFVPLGYEPELAHVEAWNVFYGEAASTQEGNTARSELYDPGTRERVEQGRQLPALDYLRGLRRRAVVTQTIIDGMDKADVDFLIMPTAPGAAPRLSDSVMQINGVDANMHEVLPRNTRLFDYTGMPALALPMGLTARGLPLSLQIAGRPWDDEDVLRVGVAFQSTTAFHQVTPPAVLSERVALHE